MRSVVVIVSLAVVPAYADTPRPQPDSKAAPAPAPTPAPKAAAPAPAPKGQPKVLPPASLADVMPKAPEPSGNATTGGPSFGGGTSAGVVIKPPAHADAQPWPKGMIIAPGDVNDAMVIAPGADGLSPGTPREPATWSKRFADAIHDGIDAIVELMLPQNL